MYTNFKIMKLYIIIFTIVLITGEHINAQVNQNNTLYLLFEQVNNHRKRLDVISRKEYYFKYSYPIYGGARPKFKTNYQKGKPRKTISFIRPKKLPYHND